MNQFGEADNRQPRLFLIHTVKSSTVVGCKLDAGSPEGLAEAPRVFLALRQWSKVNLLFASLIVSKNAKTSFVCQVFED